MRLKDLIEHLWSSHRSSLYLLGGLLTLNVLLLVALDQFVVPRVTAQETRFMQRQAEVRQLLHKQRGAANSPEQKYVLASQDLSRFLQAVPKYQEFTGLIEELLVLSGRAHLDISRVSYTSGKLKKSSLLQFGLNFNVAGDYEQVKKFIHSLEQSVRLITIKQISLQSVDDDGVNLRLSLETFFQPGSREL